MEDGVGLLLGNRVMVLMSQLGRFDDEVVLREK